MTRIVEESLVQIRQSLQRMGGLVEDQIERARRALLERDSDLAIGVKQSDRLVDEVEKEIDERCHTALARHQAVAADLRFLVAVMKITTDLERIGDLAGNIAGCVKRLNEHAPLAEASGTSVLFQAARKMVADSLDAFVRKDAGLALEVWQRDDEIDTLYKRFVVEATEVAEQQSGRVREIFQLILIARSLERIADHATNIAEDVIYFVEGQDIRHAATDYAEENAK